MTYEFIIEGGRPGAVRHDPYEGIDPSLPENQGWIGHADCAAEWDPCACHGDRLCRLGKVMRYYRSAVWYLNEVEAEAVSARNIYDAERAAADALGRDTDSFVSVSNETHHRLNEASLKVWMEQRHVRDWERDLWPLIVANAREARHELSTRARATQGVHARD